MDVTYTGKFDAKRYACAVKKAVAFAARSGAAFEWGLLVLWIARVLAAWLGGWSEDDWFPVWFLPFLLALLKCYRCIVVRIYVRQAQRMLGGDVPATCRLTDVGCATTCGDLVQMLPWQKMASHYQFLDEDTVSLMQNRAMPVMVLSDLREHGIGRDELEAVFRKAGLLPAMKSGRRRVWTVILSLIGAALVALALLSVHAAVFGSCWRMRCQDTRIRLFDLVLGPDEERRPPPDTLRTKVVRLLMDEQAPDELAYVYVPEKEEDRIGLVARYGERCCVAYFPWGHACIRPKGYWQTLQTNRTGTVYFEPEKAKWLERVRDCLNDGRVGVMCGPSETDVGSR